MFNVWTIHMSNICDKTRASLRQRRWEWLDDVELVQRGHCNYRLNSACPPSCSPLIGNLYSILLARPRDSCTVWSNAMKSWVVLAVAATSSSRSLSKAGAGHGRSWQGTKVTRETGEQEEEEEEEEEEGITRCGDAIISTLPTAAVCISTVRKKKLETNTCRPKRAVLTAQLRVCLLV